MTWKWLEIHLDVSMSGIGNIFPENQLINYWIKTVIQISYFTPLACNNNNNNNNNPYNNNRFSKPASLVSKP